MNNQKVPLAKTQLFLSELENFITKVEAKTAYEDIQLHPFFYSVIEQLENIDPHFGIETGMNLQNHLKVIDSNVLFSDMLIEAINKSSI